jgi:ADP-heptose:LPS heptosyltransferase
VRPETIFSDYLDVSKTDPWRHELLTTLDFLHFLGCPVFTLDDIQPQFWLSSSDKDLLAEEKEMDHPIIGLFPGGSFPKKCWEVDNYYDFSRLMGMGYTFVVFGGSADKDLAHQVELSLTEACRTVKIINLVGKTTLRELAKTVSSCNLFISMDTAGLHMAIVAGVPTIGIVGGGHYERFVPWGNPEKNVFLTKKMECFHCKFNCHKECYQCIQSVTPEEVANAAQRLLKDRSVSAGSYNSIKVLTHPGWAR